MSRRVRRDVGRAVGSRHRPPIQANPLAVSAIVTSSDLPTGAATAANQDESLAALTGVSDLLTAVSEGDRLRVAADIADNPDREVGRVSDDNVLAEVRALREDLDRLAPYIDNLPTDMAREGGVLAQLLGLFASGAAAVKDSSVVAAISPLALDASVGALAVQQRLANLLAAQQIAHSDVDPSGFPSSETPFFLVGA